MFVNVGTAITYDRFRISFDVPAPVWAQGNDGTVAGSTFTAPLVDLGRNPDTISDLRLGVDARIFGDHMKNILGPAAASPNIAMFGGSSVAYQSLGIGHGGLQISPWHDLQRHQLPVPRCCMGSPDCRFVQLDSENHMLLADEPAWARLYAEVHDFLAEPTSAPAPRRNNLALMSAAGCYRKATAFC